MSEVRYMRNSLISFYTLCELRRWYARLHGPASTSGNSVLRQGDSRPLQRGLEHGAQVAVGGNMPAPHGKTPAESGPGGLAASRVVRLGHARWRAVLPGGLECERPRGARAPLDAAADHDLPDRKPQAATRSGHANRRAAPPRSLGTAARPSRLIAFVLRPALSLLVSVLGLYGFLQFLIWAVGHGGFSP